MDSFPISQIEYDFIKPLRFIKKIKICDRSRLLSLINKSFHIMTKTEITQLSYEIIGFAIKVHKKLGPGLLEKIHEECLKYELEKKWLQC